MQKTKGISERIRPHLLIRIIEDSKIPLEEEESKLQKIKGKVENDEPPLAGGSSLPHKTGRKGQRVAVGIEELIGYRTRGHYVRMRNGEMGSQE